VQTRRLGSAGPELSVIGFGAWEAGGGKEWGDAPDLEQVLEAIRTALDAGMDWIDTAEVYGDGRSEELVREAIAGRRHELVIATKVAPSPQGTGFLPEQIAESQRAEGTSTLDSRHPGREPWGVVALTAHAPPGGRSAPEIEGGDRWHIRTPNSSAGVTRPCSRATWPRSAR